MASVHMNGRIYDPLLGRMLSADPHIQSPTNLQNYNRYSYVTNNPLSMTDPSGFFFKKLFKAIKKFFKKFATTIIGIALAFVPVVGPYLAAAWFVGVGAYYGGFKGALTAAVGIALTAGIGAYFDGLQAAVDGIQSGIELARATAHGIAQGGLAEISGGDFGAGFLSAFSGSIAGSLMSGTKTGRKVFGEVGDKNPKYIVRRTVAASVIGGTVSEISGGKFANGAATAAMVHLFNHEKLLEFETDPQYSDSESPEYATSEEILAKVKAEVSSSGDPIRLKLYGHGDEGSLELWGSGSYSLGTLEHIKSLDPRIIAKYYGDITEIDNFFNELSVTLPSGSTVEFFTCSSSAGASGAGLQSHLQGILGEGINVIMYDHKVIGPTPIGDITGAPAKALVWWGEFRQNLGIPVFGGN